MMKNTSVENILTVFEMMVGESLTRHINAGKIKKTKNLTQDDKVLLVTIMVNTHLRKFEHIRSHGEWNGHPPIPEYLLGTTFHDFNTLNKDFKKILKMGYGIPPEFHARLSQTTGFTSDDPKRIGDFLDTGERLYTFIGQHFRWAMVKEPTQWIPKETIEGSRRVLTLLGVDTSGL
jgi:hypothetical protein